MKPYQTTTIALALLLMGTPALWAQKKTLAIGPVEVNPAVVTSASQANSATELRRIVESTDAELLNAFQQTRRFDLFARSDLAAIMGEQDLAQSGNLDMDDPNTAESFRLGGVQYLVVTSISDFQNYEETATFQAVGRSVTKRVIRLGAIARIYDTTTGKLLESARISTTEQDLEDEPSYQSVRTGELSDDLIGIIGQQLAEQIANRVVEVLYPARIVGQAGRIVIFNRGDGFNISVGDIWKVFAEGEEMVDPDTGESLGSMETEVGTIRVIEVLPRTTRAEVVDDYGIERMQIVRPAN